MTMTQEKTNRNLDRLVWVVSLAVIALGAIWVFQSGMFSTRLTADTKLAWHLVRSSGIVAYVMLLGSTVWGLVMSAQFLKNWSPGPISMTMHSTISWLALVLSLIHALLLMFDGYFKFTLGDLFIPFSGPYRPEAVGLGTTAFWAIVIISLSFSFKKWMGHKNWKRLHYVSYATFGLVSLHGLFAGTEGTHLGLRLLIGIGMASVILLLGIRVGKARQPARLKA